MCILLTRIVRACRKCCRHPPLCAMDAPDARVYIPDMLVGQVAHQVRVPAIEILTAAVEDLRFWHWDQAGWPYWRLYWNDAPGCYIEPDVELDPRHIVIIPPHTPTRLRQRHRVGHLFIHFTVSPPLHHPRQRPWRFALIPARTRSMRHLFATLAGEHPAESLPLTLLSLIASQLLQIPTADWQHHPMDRRVHHATLQIERELHLRLTVDTLASQAGMSTAAFARLFRKAIGLSPHQYMLRRRLDAAGMRLGTTTDSIDTIAQACGFCDRYHLTRAFTRHHGISPAAFRRAHA